MSKSLCGKSSRWRKALLGHVRARQFHIASKGDLDRRGTLEAVAGGTAIMLIANTLADLVLTAPLARNCGEYRKAARFADKIALSATQSAARLLLVIDAGNELAVIYEAIQDRRQIASEQKYRTIKSALALNGVKP
jgi:hypothetical protein